MRERLLSEGAVKAHVVKGINGDEITAIAWRMKRDREMGIKK